VLPCNLKVWTKYSPFFAFFFLPFASTAEVSFLLVFDSVQNVLRAKGVIDLLIFDFLCRSFFSIKNARTHWKTLLFSPFFCAVTNRRERKHMRLIVVLKHPFFQGKVSFWPLFCLVLVPSPYNTMIYLNSNCFLLLFSLTCSSECYHSIPKRRQVGYFFHQEPCSIRSRATMVVERVDCGGSQTFTLALGTNFYGEKVTIFTCSEMDVSEGNKRFLASPET